MSSVDAVTTIREKLPDIVASDMEAAPIAQVASFYNIPVLNVRGVSDHVGGDALIPSRKHSKKSISKRIRSSAYYR